MGRTFNMFGQMVALLSSGVVLTDLQNDVMPLIAEMEYVLVEVPLAWDARIPTYVSRMRGERLRSCPGVWWRSAESVSLIADSLENMFFCVVDDFLTPDLAEKLASGIFSSKPVGVVPVEGRNGWTRGGTARTAEAINSEGDFEARNERLARSLLNASRGDVLKFSDGEADMPGTDEFCSAVDSLVLALQDCKNAEVRRRLAHTNFANSAMFTVYPGGGTRYVKHTDNSLLSDGRRLTTIVYLNHAWEPSHGGQLRIYEPTMRSMRVKMDVEPVFNRLVLFWSSDEVPHEVMPSFRDRAAVSLWYVCAKECLQTEEAFKRLVTKVRCVGGKDPSACLKSCGETDEQRQLLFALGNSSCQDEARVQERRAVLSAARHDFQGCDAHRRQRTRLNTLFGWDDHAARVQWEVHQEQLQQLQLFQAAGIPIPPGVKPIADVLHAQTSAPLVRDGQRRGAEHPRGSEPESWEIVD